MNCIIIDDEYPSREELKFLINKYSSINILSEFDNPIDALKYIESCQHLDIIFLDINMPNLNGMTLAKIISKFENKPKIVFVTAYKEYALEAFEIEAEDYILKPYSEDRMKKLLLKLDIQDENVCQYNKITFSNGEKILVVDKNDISCIKASDRKVIICYNYKLFDSKSKFCDLIKDLLNYDNFFQTHRSYVVNLDKVTEIDHWFNNTYLLVLKGVKEKIPVSRNYIKEFRKRMKI